MKTLFLLLLAGIFKIASCADLIVDGSGNGDFSTIQSCVNNATTGDSCLIKAGRYHEEVEIKNKNDVTIMGYDNERPVIDGTIILTNSQNGGKWKMNTKTGVCSGKIKNDVFQLFLDNDMMTNARWPNALWSDKTSFSNKYWAHSAMSSTRGKMVDDGHADGGLGLAGTGLDLTGAMAVLNVGSFNTFVKPVEDHNANQNWFKYDDDFGDINFQQDHNQYYLDSHLALLDNPGEWHYDMDTKMLRFIPPTGKCPTASDAVRGRTIDYAMTITKSKGIKLANMDFFASNVMAEGTTKRTDEVADITLDSLNFDFPSSSRRMLKEFAVPKHTRLIAKGFGYVNVINCKFFGAEGSALEYWGSPAKIHNNAFEWCDWSGQMGLVANGGYGTVWSSPTGKNEEFIGNTLWYNGASAGYRSGKTPTVSDNMVVGQADGLLMNDGSGIQIQTKCQIDATVERNWVYDSPKYGIRFDHSPGNLGSDGHMLKNVVWNTKGIMVKGDDHEVDGNLCLDNTAEASAAASLMVIHILRQELDVHNKRTTITNNAATQADGGINMQVSKPYPRWPLPGKQTNNYADHNLKTLLVDTDNNDFRPKSSKFPAAGMIGKATGNTIGPYPAEGSTITQYDIPGRKTLHEASHPIPAHNSKVSGRDAIMFRPGFRCDSHKVYVSTANGKLSKTPTETLGKNANGRMDNAVMINASAKGKYTWRVDCIEEGTGKTDRGDTWKFTVV